MTIKEQIIQELDQIPEAMQEKVFEYLLSLKSEKQQPEEDVWQAYLKSEKQRQEVYRRLANS